MNTNETAPAPEHTMNQETPAARPQKSDIRSFIAGDAFKSQVALALPKHMTPDRFTRIALTALTRTPKLLDCTRESLLRCLMDCSQLGLEPDGRNAHLIPYKDQCTLIIDYKGLIALARRSGEVAVFRAELVKENDEFAWENGAVSHSINWRADRGETQCVYSYVKFKDGAEDWEVMTLTEVDAIRKRSRAGNSGPWQTDFDEMAKKTVIRRHSKRLTLSPEFSDALDKDADREERPAKGREVQPVPMLALDKEPQRIEPPDESQGPKQRLICAMMAYAEIEEPALMAVLNANYLTAADRIQGMTEAECEVTIGKWATVVKEVKK